MGTKHSKFKLNINLYIYIYHRTNNSKQSIKTISMSFKPSVFSKPHNNNNTTLKQNTKTQKSIK